MERREFFKTTAVTAAALAAQGYLPLLAAEKKRKGKKTQASVNTFTDPCAIEPLTGYLPKFSPAAGKLLGEAITAQYSLILYSSSAAKSKNSVKGSMDVSFNNGRCKAVETRAGGHRAPKNTIKTTLQFSGEFNTASKWTLASTIEGRNDLGFTENGAWDGKTMTVKSKSWTQERTTTHPLIGRWTLLPLLASGTLKKKSLTFDLLDDSTLRPNQTLIYEGEIDVPVKGGTAKLDSYAQTGQGIVPTHYLVDNKGRVQLITMTTVNWALTG
jgi:hypothetical protein